MPQSTEQDVRRVLAALAKVEGDGQAGPAVRPEDVERVRAITDEPDMALRARKMDAWLAEVRAQLEANARGLEALRREAGVEPMRGSDRLSPAAKAELERALEGYGARIVDEVAREARAVGGGQAARQGGGGGRPPRPGRIRV